LKILDENKWLSLEKNFFGGTEDYQQDKDPNHTAKLVKTLYQDNNDNVLNWPSQSLDPVAPYYWETLVLAPSLSDEKPGTSW